MFNLHHIFQIIISECTCNNFRKEHTPDTFNGLDPYFNTHSAEFVIELVRINKNITFSSLLREVGISLFGFS